MDTKAKLNNILDKITIQQDDDFYTKHIAVDTASYIRHLVDNATAVQFVEFYSDDRDAQFDRIFGGAKGEVWVLNNTYNYNEPYTHAMVTVEPIFGKDSDAYTVALAPCYGGDIRSNYGDFIVLSFTSFWDFLKAQNGYYTSHAYDFQLDGKQYTCVYYGFREYYRLTAVNSGGDTFDHNSFCPEPWTEDDFLKSAHDYITGVSREE